MNDSTLIAGPYTHSGNSVAQTMRLVMYALVPATIAGLYLYGWPAIYLFVVTIFTAILAETFALKIANKPVRPFLLDGSALLTGWLLAMTLPPWAPWWIGVAGSLLAIIVGKHVFGGIGQNLFNPAMVARVALLISFPFEMTLFNAPAPLLSASTPGFLEALNITFTGAANFGSYDALTSATPLGHYKTELGLGLTITEIASQTSGLWQMTTGQTSGSMGETSFILILLGGLFLIYKRVIRWYIPVAMLAGLFFPATLMHLINPDKYIGPLLHVASGAFILGAFFIATDLVTSPVTIRGQLIFGAGCGILVYIIRTWAGYPEGVAFAVMLMNACTPLIDHYFKPRIYGRDRNKQPLTYSEEKVEADG